MSTSTPPRPHDSFAALRIRDFSLFLSARFLLTLGVQIQSVVVGIQITKLTGDPWMLGLIGLSEAIPFIAVALFAGHVADVVRRKRIMLLAALFLALASWALFAVSFDEHLLLSFGTFPVYGIIFCTGIARGFLGPVFPAMLSQLVPRALYANAATWQSNLWQTASVLGPALGGIIFGTLGVLPAYAICSALITGSLFFAFFITDHPLPLREKKEPLLQSLTSGFRFVFSNQVMLSAFSLDLFAVLFGGAVAMIPLFSQNVLHAGENADFVTGLLRAAPAIGAILTGLVLTKFPPTRHAGRNLYIAVIGFGLCIIGFAFSEFLWLSFLLLIASGAFDSISVVVRSTILQLLTPDNMRGRVAAVNGIFIGSSNEIGEFESGAAARIFGLQRSVAIGGCMTIFVVIMVMLSAPKLRKLNLNKLT